jgi:hypothetical protein
MRLGTNGSSFFCKTFVRGAVPRYSGIGSERVEIQSWYGGGHAFALYLSSDLSVIQALTSIS